MGPKKHPHPDVYPVVMEFEDNLSALVKPRYRYRISKFVDYTSMHGPAHIKRVHAWPHKLLWIVILLSAVGVLLYQIIVLTMKYRENPYVVLTDTRFDRRLKFPVVTLCNINAYR